MRFLTWANVALLGSLNLFQLSNASNHRSGLAWGVVLVGGISALGAWTAKSPARAQLIGVIVGLVGGAFAALVLVDFVHAVRHTDGLVRISYGPLIAIGGCAMMFVGGLIRTRRVPIASSVPTEIQAPESYANVVPTDTLTELERLRQLRDDGVLTEAQAETLKARILGSGNDL